MALIWKDKINGVDKIKADDINAIARAIIDLENNAELSGDGSMVFKSVVSELPETANEGEVYKLNQDYSGGDKWILISSGENDIDADGTVSDYEITMYNYNSTGSVIYHSIADVIDNKTGDSVKIWIHVYREATGASGDVYFDATKHYGNYSEGPGMYYASITGKKDNATTTDNIGNWDWTHYEAYYFGEEIYPAGTYIRHNGEWVEISKDGVTKAEMESYIEETLLGGEW